MLPNSHSTFNSTAQIYADLVSTFKRFKPKQTKLKRHSTRKPVSTSTAVDLQSLSCCSCTSCYLESTRMSSVYGCASCGCGTSTQRPSNNILKQNQLKLKQKMFFSYDLIRKKTNNLVNNKTKNGGVRKVKHDRVPLQTTKSTNAKRSLSVWKKSPYKVVHFPEFVKSRDIDRLQNDVVYSVCFV
jgi:hypothetical protein